MSDPKNPKSATTAKPETKDYTLEVPMFDLGEVIKLVTKIHEDALETATMIVVAKGCGYAGPSSTPFFRRIVAGRLFKLLTSQGAALTPQALDYLKPVTEEARSQALRDSIFAIPAYEELIQTHQGKRLNAEIICNGFMRKFLITQAAALICAKVFISSLKFAGFLESDGTLKRLGATQKSEQGNEGAENGTGNGGNGGTTSNEGENKANQRSYILVLDEKRSVEVKAPLSIKQSELKRLQDWLALQLLVVPDQPTNPVESR